MPDWNDPAIWQQAYSMRGARPQKEDSLLPTGDGFGEQLSYLDGRKFILQLSDDGQPGLAHFRFNLQKIGATGTFTPAAETLIVGCGFGWMIETIIDIGSNAVWGTDTSTLIQSLKSDPNVGVRSDVQPLILSVDITDVDAADQFKAAGAGTNQGKFRNVVTELVLGTLSIGDINLMLDACDALRAPGQSNVFHLVVAYDRLDPEQTDDEIILSKLTLAEWIALRPGHVWIDSYTGNFGGGQ
ncbi:MAG: hypothetical protein ACWGQW_02625 [bacterium]